ncbi:MAG: COP23 domain-containing protein [Microcystaceae cyanobacterium]
MLLQTRFKSSFTVFTEVSLSLSILLLFSSQNATALKAPVSFTAQETKSYNLRQVTQQISQAQQDTPPDVIIDTNPQGSSSPLPTPPANDTRFTCQLANGEYTVMYHPESQPSQSYPWAVPRQLGDGWTAEKRCNTISQRLELYRPDGLLELKTSVENSYNIICVTTQQDPNCRIVLTIPPGQDAEVTRDLVFQNLTVADSGQSTQGVNTFVGNNSDNQLLNQIGQVLGGNFSNLGSNTNSSSGNGINLQPFLDPADGGTGTQLQKSRSIPSNSRSLNPDRFR